MNNNPYRSNEVPPPNQRPRSMVGGGIMLLLGLGGILFVFAALTIPFSRRGSRPAVWRMQSMNNLKYIGLALHNYESKYKAFPPAYTINEAGEKLHSWRSLILPFMEGGQEIYTKIDLTKPWDAEENAEVREASLYFFQSPVARLAHSQTTYFAVVGKNCFLHPEKARTFAEITDGTSQTIAAYESSKEMAVHWMDPSDPALPMELGSVEELPHGKVMPILLVDGSVQSLDASTPPSDMAALKTIAGGEDDVLN